MIAQGVNFLILIWLLKKFLYRPILEAVDQREQEIAARIAEAERLHQLAQETRSQFEREKTALEQRREDLLRVAEDQARLEHHRLLEEARQDAEELANKRMSSLHQREKELARSLLRRTQEEAVALARQLLLDLAGQDLDQRIAATLVQRIGQLQGAERQALVAALSNQSRPLILRSSHPLDEAARTSIEQAIEHALGYNPGWVHETAVALVNGLEIVAQGHKLSWNSAELLQRTAAEANLAGQQRWNQENLS